MDVTTGFWHVKLEEESSYLTTFNTPFGKYRWVRMPFGLCSAPEVFQRKINSLIEGLTGIEVIADDFLIYGCGNTTKEAIIDHDDKLITFLNVCQQKNIHLNIDKFKLRETSMTYIGHTLSGEGVQPGQDKVKSILQMPTPKDPTEIKRFLGMVQYLDKFIDRLSAITVHLRKLLHKYIPWNWTEKEEEELRDLKKAVKTTPVLRYYGVNK